MLDRQLQQSQTARARQRRATGVRERGHHAHDLGLDARGQLIERVHVDAFRAGRHGVHGGAGIAQRLHLRESRRLDDGVVARLQHDARQQRQRLLRAAGDGQLGVRVAAQAARGRQARQLMAQAGLAVDVRILQAGAQARHDLGRGQRQAVHIEQLGRRIAAGQRDRARTHGVGHERADRRSGRIQEGRGKGVFALRWTWRDDGQEEGPCRPRAAPDGLKP